MNVVFISPHFPPHFHLFCRALKAEGVRVLGVGDCPRGELAPEVLSALDDYASMSESSYEALLRAVAFLTWKHGKIDRVESLNEFWLGWESRLRDDFNIDGPKSDRMALHRSKTGMRDLFRSAGVPCTEGERIVSADQVRAFAQVRGYPLVFKPDVGVGAAWTFPVHNDAQLEDVLSRPLANFVVEQFCPGALTSFDGLTDSEGRILFCSSLIHSSGVMEIVNEQRDVYYYTRREIPPGLQELGQKVVSAFHLRERFFHIEFFEEGDRFTALEINLRPPGGFTTDMFNYTADIDIYALWARVLTGQPTAGWTYQRGHHCAHVSRRHGRHYRLPHQRVVDELGPALMAFREIPPVLSGAMGNWMYLLRYPDVASIERAIARIQEQN